MQIDELRRQLEERFAGVYFLTRKELMELLRVSITVIDNLEKKGILHPIKTLGSVRYAKEEVLDFILKGGYQNGGKIKRGRNTRVKQ